MTVDKSTLAAYEESLLVYDRYNATVKDNRAKKVHIFGSSSKGNSVYFTEIRTLIDLGLPMKRYNLIDPNFFFNVDYIILTHEHPDHVNIATLSKIIKTYPAIKILIHPNMWQALIGPKCHKRVSEKHLATILSANADQTTLISETDSLVENEQLFQGAPKSRQFVSADRVQLLSTREHLPFVFTPHVVSHGPIKNLAIELNYQSTRILYASDLDSVQPTAAMDALNEGLPTLREFDIICLEANYDETYLNQYLQERPQDLHAQGNLRHISEQAAQWYINQHLKESGIYIPLHASRMFGTYFQKALEPQQKVGI